MYELSQYFYCLMYSLEYMEIEFPDFYYANTFADKSIVCPFVNGFIH